MAGEFKIGGAGPGKASGAYVNSEHAEAHLLAYLHPTEEERTSNRDSKEKYSVAVCPAVICITDKKAWSDTDVSGKYLVPRLVTSENEIVVVRLTLGEARPGQSAPVIPEDAITEEIEMAQEVFSRYAVRMPTGRITFDVVTFNHDNASATEEKF
jgi:hypothetical protein